jgi:hypothetical protein
MSHFAKIEDGIVTQVIVAEQDFIDMIEGTWVQTSYNTRGGVHYIPDTNTPSEDQSKALRKNYAGIGYTYDETLDAFIPPKPSLYPSWILNEEKGLWEPPIPMPTETPSEGYGYMWDEENLQWKLISL